MGVKNSSRWVTCVMQLKKNKTKKKHLLWMEIQLLPWDKSALPQCGWACMQGNSLV